MHIILDDKGYIECHCGHKFSFEFPGIEWDGQTDCPKCGGGKVKKEFDTKDGGKVELSQKQVTYAVELRAKQMVDSLYAVKKQYRHKQKPHLPKMYVKGHKGLAPDAQKAMFRASQLCRKLGLHPKVYFRAILEWHGNSNFVRLNSFWGKRAEEICGEWLEVQQAKFRDNKTVEVAKKAENVFDEARLRTDRRYYEQLLDEYEDEDVAFGMGVGKFDINFIFKYIEQADEGRVADLMEIVKTMNPARWTDLMKKLGL